MWKKTSSSDGSTHTALSSHPRRQNPCQASRQRATPDAVLEPHGRRAFWRWRRLRVRGPRGQHREAPSTDHCDQHFSARISASRSAASTVSHSNGTTLARDDDQSDHTDSRTTIRQSDRGEERLWESARRKISMCSHATCRSHPNSLDSPQLTSARNAGPSSLRTWPLLRRYRMHSHRR